MPNWRKGVQGPQRKYRKTRRGHYLGKKTTTSVRKIAKNTILRMAETKAVGKQSGGSPFLTCSPHNREPKTLMIILQMQPE